MRIGSLCASLAGLLLYFAGPALAEPRPSIAMHGEPALAAGFDHFPYADPQARRGGRLVMAAQGTFDGLNPFIVKGSTAAQGISPWVVQPLMARSYDEPFTLYGLIAETIETPDDRSWVEFALNPKARFSDGTPVTAEDVAFSWNLLRMRGRPNFRGQYNKVERVETPDERRIRFVLKDRGDYELPLILGLMPVFAKHATDPETFEETSFTAPMGSGPYIVASVDRGAGITYRRNPNFWAADLPTVKGSFNFDEIKIDYYRDSNALFEAFKAGLYDLRIETDARRWQAGYNFPALRDGRVKRESIRTEAPKGMYGFAMNTRRPLFQDVRVREALSMLIDVDWLNRNLYGGALSPSGSYFEDSMLSALGRPADEREKALVGPFPAAVRSDVMDGSWQPPKSDGSGRDRKEIRQALKLFTDAGYRIIDGVMTEKANSKAFRFEILVDNREDERLALAFADAARRLGIAVNVRQVDSVQYQKRRTEFDFDVVLVIYPVSASPGNEQRVRFSSGAAEAPGSLNFAGVHSPAVDAVLDAILAAREENAFVSAVRTLDRLLISGFYVAPLFHAKEKWLAYSSRLTHPQRLPRFEIITDVWSMTGNR